MPNKFISVILAGGTGKRLWPLSRRALPKQFLKLLNNESLLQNTLSRVNNLNTKGVYLICNEEHRYLLEKEISSNKLVKKVILEPVSRNTAVAVTLAALCAKPEDLLLILPSDHLITNDKKLSDSINKTIVHAEQGKVVLFGIKPRFPSTGFGYIKAGKDVDGYLEIIGFKEKPKKKLANKFFEEGNYFWNSGLLLSKASTLLEEIEIYRPDIIKSCKKTLETCSEEGVFSSLDKGAFLEAPNEPIDTAILEETDKSILVELKIDWDDLGNWKAVDDACEKDSEGNVSIGDNIKIRTSNSYIRSGHRLVATMGIKDTIIVDTKDAVLISSKDMVDRVGNLVKKLEEKNRTEVIEHKEVLRPWGTFESLISQEGFQVKLITVNPKQKISLQKHDHRSEHWTVVSGKASITKGKEIFNLFKDEYVNIPQGEIHSLENVGEEILKIIEVQIGDYLGEDDIYRYEDIYGRVDKP